jgi:hypothetical protein
MAKDNVSDSLKRTNNEYVTAKEGCLLAVRCFKLQYSGGKQRLQPKFSKLSLQSPTVSSCNNNYPIIALVLTMIKDKPKTSWGQQCSPESKERHGLLRNASSAPSKVSSLLLGSETRCSDLGINIVNNDSVQDKACLMSLPMRNSMQSSN